MHAKRLRKRSRPLAACYAVWMQPNLAQVLNTLAHEIRTPLAVSQGYLKLYLDGRLTNAEDTRRAFEQARQALGALAAMCVDMGKVSALSESASLGVPERVSTTELLEMIKSLVDDDSAAWSGAPAPNTSLTSTNKRDLAQAIAVVVKAAFDEQREVPHAIRICGDGDLTVLAGAADALPAVEAGPEAPGAQPVNFVKGGRGLKLIWAAFVLDKHRVQTWSSADRKAVVGFRIPLVQA
jgi:signal transduction histidine kinase